MEGYSSFELQQICNQQRTDNLLPQQSDPCHHSIQGQMYSPEDAPPDYDTVVNQSFNRPFQQQPYPSVPQDYNTVASQPFNTTSQRQPYLPVARVSPNRNQQNYTDVVVDSQPTWRQEVQLEEQEEQTENTPPNTIFFVKCSIILTILSLLLGAWYSLICSIPATFLAINAHIAKKQGDLETAKGSIGCVILLDFLAFISLVIGICAIPFIILGVFVHAVIDDD